MNVVTLLSQLKEKSVKLSLQDDKLVCQIPKVGIGEELRAALIANRDRLIQFIKNQHVSPRAELPEIVPLNTVESEMSYAQQRLWFIDRMAGGTLEYNIAFAFGVEGPLDIAVAERSIQHIIQRHSALRTVFSEQQGVGIQRVRETFDFGIERFKISLSSQEKQQARIDKLISAFNDRPYDLSRDLLIRIGYVALPAQNDIEQSIILFNMHHIASDGWSIGVLIKEFFACYSAFKSSLEPALPPLGIQYIDYSHWQKSWLSGGKLIEQQQFWGDYMAGAPLCHNLPLDKARADTPRVSGLVERHLSAELFSQVTQLCRLSETTLFMLMQSVFAIHIGRLSNETDVVIGSPIAGRPVPELNYLIGLFINTRLFRCEFSDNPSFLTLLHRTREDHRAVTPYVDIPFDKIVDHVKPPRDHLYKPLFQVMINLDNTETVTAPLDGVKFSQIYDSDTQSKFDLSLYMVEQPTNKQHPLKLRWVYDARIFTPKKIEFFATEFNALLARLINTPHQPILDHPWHTAPERLANHDHNAGIDDVSRGSIQQMFEQQVALHPAKPALSFLHKTITYAELNKQVNQLAHVISGHYLVDAGTRVAVMIGRGERRVQSCLALFKLAACCVPVSDDLPAERIRYMLEDASVGLVLIDTQTLAKHAWIQSLDHLKYFVIDAADVSAMLENADTDNPLTAMVPRHTEANIIYTSGSTGRPKGVIGNYGALINRILWMQRTLPCDEKDVMAHIGSMAFIRSVWEMLMPLCSGCHLVLFPRDIVLEPRAFWQQLNQLKVTRMVTTPSYLKTLSDTLVPGSGLTSLKQVYVCGELLLSSYARAFSKRFPTVEIFNFYGATEVMSNVLWSRFDAATTSVYAPVGRPIDGVSVQLVDGALNPVPDGVTGQILISGAAVANGYVSTQKEASGFVVVDGAPAFLTGDLGVVGERGEIECKGRADHQVKLRGYRIEPGEIEHHLLAIEAISACKVTVSSGENGTESLVAYLVYANESADISSLMLKKKLLSVLPSYMVPDIYIRLDSLPLTRNGKIDLLSLPKPSAAHYNKTIVTASTATEAELVSIWAELLGRDASTLSVSEQFFELGGHSLMAVRLVSEIRARLGKELAVRQIFESPYIDVLAQIIEQSASMPSVPPIVKSQYVLAQVPLSYPQRRVWLIDKIQGSSAEYNIPLAFHLTGEFNITVAEEAFSRLVKRHEVLRTSYVEVGSEVFQSIGSAQPFKIVCTDISLLPAQEKQRCLEETLNREIQTPFNLSRDPILRANYILLEAADRSATLPPRGVFVFNIHHIASDGWSMNVLLREFVAQYQAIVNQQPEPLAELPLQYADYAIWQNNWLGSDMMQAHFDYWLTQLADAPATHSLPLKQTRPEIKHHTGARVTGGLSAEVSQGIQRLSAELQMTWFMLVHAMLALAVSRHSGSQDIVIGTPVANRLLPELTSLIGFFVNTLPLRVSTEQACLEQYLAHVRQVHLDAQSHQQVPFEQLVDRLEVPRTRSNTPIFQIMLTANSDYGFSGSDDAFTLEDIQMSPVFAQDVQVKFDLDIRVDVRQDGVFFEWIYDVELFSQAYIERLDRHLCQLLTDLTGRYSHLSRPDIELAELTMLMAAESHQLITTFCYTAQDFDQTTLVHSMFERCAAEYPERIALEYENEQLTYQELNIKANQLAHQLRADGVGIDTLVGVYMTRSIEMVVAILAVLKAGGAYVPLDPELPEKRLVQLMRETQMRYVLSWSELYLDNSHVFSAHEGLKLYDTKHPNNDWQNAATGNPVQLPGQSANNLAYIIFTSGSTGNPKGVMIEHRALYNRLDWMQNQYQLTQQDHVLQKTPFNFDVSVWEFLWTLGYGARLIMARPAGHKDPTYLSQLIQERAITIIHFVPSMLEIYLQSAKAEQNASLRAIFCSGEALSPNIVQTAQTKLRHVALHNLYGPTEAAIDVSYFDCAAHVTDCVVPIGRPIQNTQLFVLDKKANLIPQGSIGELYIGGEGLARGYWNNAELTNTLFVTPKWLEQRLYKTGDLVRYRDDGEIEYIGRADSQVKMRGFRIELGEIEHHVQSCVQVHSCVVKVSGYGKKQKLVAYVLPVQAEDFDVAAVIREIKQVLPDYMVPTQFITLANWPLNANGKVDRKALPEPELQTETSGGEQPSSETQKTLAGIWLNILESTQFDIHTNFFEAGGNSLMLPKLEQDINQAFGRQINLLSFFEYTSIAKMAAYIDQLSDGSDDTKQVGKKNKNLLAQRRNKVRG